MFTRLIATGVALLMTAAAATAVNASAPLDVHKPVSVSAEQANAPTPATSSPATATSGPVPATAAASQPADAPAMTTRDVQIFFDGLVPYALRRGDIAGGVVVVVKDGRILFAKGYGYADVAKRKPVIADRTLFRPGSISKTLTWTAVMQLVGEGKLDLNRDVNAYLDFKIPEKAGQKLTLRDLLTQTPGFEDTMGDEFLSSTGKLFPIGEYLKKHLPPFLFPPGKIVAYSNYGATLAGYIVQRVSGEPFEQYVQNHIFKPLDMDHSTFEQPPPASLKPDISIGYHMASNAKTIPFEAIEVGPAGSMTATGTDMAHFMIAQLNGGSYHGTSILSPATLAQMHTPHSNMAPGLNGYDLGFYQENRNGLRIIGHAGDTGAFHSDLHLLLDKGVGVFMSFNSAGKNGAVENVRTALFRDFLDRYYPYTPPQEKTVADPGRDAARVAGWYLGTRRIESTLRLLYAVTQAHVTANPDGTIQIDLLKDLSGTPLTWREVGPLDYREVGGQTHTKFVTAKDGTIRYWISDDFLPIEVFQPVHGLKSLGMLKPMASLFIATLLLTLGIWIGGAIVRRRMRARLELTRGQFWWRLASRMGATLLLLLLLGWVVLFSFVFGSDSARISTFLAILYVFGVLAGLGAVAMLVEAVQRIVRGPGGWLVRIGEAVLGLSALYGIWIILAFGLANFSFTY